MKHDDDEDVDDYNYDDDINAYEVKTCSSHGSSSSTCTRMMVVSEYKQQW